MPYETDALSPTLRQQEAFLALAETLPVLIALIQGDKLVYVNPAGCAMLGYPPGYFVGRNFWEAVSPADQEAARERGRARQAGVPQPRRFVERLRHADGRDVWIDYSVDLLTLDGKITTLVTGQDVTERRRMEDELRRNEELFRSAFEHAAAGKALIGSDGRFLRVNPSLCRMVGLSEEEVLASPVEALIHPEEREAIFRLVTGLLTSGRPSASRETRLIRKDGRPAWALLNVTRVGSEECCVPHLLVEFHDVTERREAERLLKESEARLAEAQRIGRLGSWEWDVARDRILWSEEMYRLFDIAPSEFRPSYEGYLSLLHPEDRPRAARVVEEAFRTGLPFEFEHRILLKDGQVRRIRGRGEVFRNDRGEIVRMAGTGQDVTELRRAEEALRESEERYRALVEHAPQAIVVGDADTGKFVEVNPRALALFGMSRDQLLAMGPEDCSPPFQPDGRPSSRAARDYMERALRGEAPVFEWVHRNAAGQEIYCRIHLARLPAAGRNLVCATINDVTDEKRLQERLRHQDKMAAIGLLAAGVAHEIGNPLQALSMAAQSLDKRLSDDYGRRKLALIGEHIDRLSRIVRQMSDLARPQNAQAATCDLNAAIRRALEVVRYDRRSREVEFVFDLAPDAPAVTAVEDQLTQVFLNLAFNALDAMIANPPERPRRLRVSTRREEGADGPRVRVAFEDTGPGIPEALRHRLFQPFFTTKDAGRGTGLGLSVSDRIVVEHGGRLRFEPAEAGGARFVFELPAREGR
jgi:PAS domain S-box-containing protein